MCRSPSQSHTASLQSKGEKWPSRDRGSLFIMHASCADRQYLGSDSRFPRCPVDCCLRFDSGHLLSGGDWFGQGTPLPFFSFSDLRGLLIEVRRTTNFATLMSSAE